MTDREFREIQLSGKQIVFLVMSAVVVAVVIFLLGVAVGRDLRGPEIPMSASLGTETVVSEDPPAQPAQELGYHDLLAGAAGSAGAQAPSPSTPPPTPPVETIPPPIPDPVPEVPPSTRPAPEVTGDWFLQVGAFSGRQAADGMVGNLKKLGVPAFVLVPTTGSPDRLFRVRVGPYGTQAEADGVRTRLAREGYSAEIRR